MTIKEFERSPARLTIVVGLALAAFLFASPARATTCVANASNISFGTLAVSAVTGAVAQGSIYEGCSSGWQTDGNLATCNAIGAGTNSVSQTNRTMTNGGYAIAYQLYSDSGYSTPYAYPGSDIFNIPYSTRNGGYTTTTTYAKILSTPANLPPGTYTDAYTSTAQTFVDFDTWRTPDPPVTCGTNPNYTGLAAPFTVSVTVAASCSITASAMNFGSVGALASGVSASTNLSVTCTYTTPYSIALGTGGAPGATTTTRAMTGPGGSISYGLYRDAAHTLNWGNNATGSSPDTVSGTGAGAAQSLPVYGLVPAQRTPALGTYNDVVVVTVSY